MLAAQNASEMNHLGDMEQFSFDNILLRATHVLTDLERKRIDIFDGVTGYDFPANVLTSEKCSSHSVEYIVRCSLYLGRINAHTMTDGVLSLFGNPCATMVLAEGRILKWGGFKAASINVGPKGMPLVKALGGEQVGHRDDSKAFVHSTSRWIYRGNSLISQTVLQPLPISKGVGVLQRTAVDLAGDILSGLEVKSVLEPVVDGLSADECSKLMMEVGNRNWSSAMDVFSFLRVRGAYEEADIPNSTEVSTEFDEKFSMAQKPGGLLKGYTTLIGILGRHSRIIELVTLLREAEQQGNLGLDIRFYNAAAEAYANVGLAENVSEVITQMERKGLQPDSRTHELKILASLKAKIPQLDEALRVFRSMLEKNLDVGAKTYLKLMDATFDSRNLKAGEEVFNAMRSTSHQVYSKTWVKIIQLHASVGRYKKAEEHFRSMRASGISPNSSIYDALLLAYCRAGRMDEALSVFREYKLTLKPSLVAYNYLIDVSGKRGRYEETMALYSELSGSGLRPSTATFTSLICAMVEAGKFEKADRMYKKMLQNNYIPSGHTVTVMLQAYISSGWTRLGHEVYGKLRDFNIEATPLIYGSILKLYVQGRWLKEVVRVMMEMESKQLEPDTAGYGVLISALGEVGDETISFTNAMRNSKWEPCRIASLLVLSSVADVDGLEVERDTTFDEAWRYLEILARNEGRDTNRSFYNALMDALWRRGLRGRCRLVMRRGRDLLSWYNRPRSGAGPNSMLDLRGLSVGGALVALIDWLQVTTSNAKETGHLMVIYTGSLDMRMGKSFKGRGVGAVKQAVTAYLEELCSPFGEVQEYGPGKLVADFDFVGRWVSEIDNKTSLQLLDFK